MSENQLSSGQIGHERSEDPSSAEVEDQTCEDRDGQGRKGSLKQLKSGLGDTRELLKWTH